MNKLNQIRTLLGLKPVIEKFASATLIDGTKVETADGQELVEGSTLYVIGEDGARQLAPPGVHQTSENEIEVDANGQILRVSSLQSLEEVKEEPKKEELPIETIKEIVETIIEEEMKKVRSSMELLVSELEAVKTEMGKTKDKYDQFSKTPGSDPLRVTFNSTPEDEVDRKIRVLQHFKTDPWSVIKNKNK